MIREHLSVRSSAICAGLVAATSLLAGCFGQSQPLTPPPPAPAASPAPSPAASPVVLPAASPPPAPAAAPGETHTVAEGDTLASIAQKYYEDGGLWRKIYEANREAIGDNPDSIKIGQNLKIPPKE